MPFRSELIHCYGTANFTLNAQLLRQIIIDANINAVHNTPSLISVYPMCELCCWCGIQGARCNQDDIVSGVEAMRIARIHLWSVRTWWMTIRPLRRCLSCILADLG